MLQIQHARLILGLLGIGDDFLDQGCGILMDADDRCLDGLGRRDAQSHRHPDRQAKLVGEDDIRRIGDRHQDRPVLAEADR